MAGERGRASLLADGVLTGYRVLSQMLGADQLHTVVLGSSMTVRYADLATAAPVRVVMGDLTFVHDVGGLARGVGEPEVDLQVVVLNDAGGGIFATLEHGRPEHAGVYPRFFGTPQQVDIAALAAGFGAAHQRVRTTAELTGVLASPVLGRSVVKVELGAG